MSFSSNNDRHSFPHRVSTGYEINNVSVGPMEIVRGYLDGSILKTNYDTGQFQTRRKRSEIRTFTFTYDSVLGEDEWNAIWTFYNDKAEHELYYFFINLYYFDVYFTNEWIGVNFSQKFELTNFDNVLGKLGLKLVENRQATLTHEAPT